MRLGPYTFIELTLQPLTFNYLEQLITSLMLNTLDTPLPIPDHLTCPKPPPELLLTHVSPGES